MTLVMSIVVVPFGVIAALYLREYARGRRGRERRAHLDQQLAGVPSIVFGVFGLGFFCYFMGAPSTSCFSPRTCRTDLRQGRRALGSLTSRC